MGFAYFDLDLVVLFPISVLAQYSLMIFFQNRNVDIIQIHFGNVKVPGYHILKFAQISECESFWKHG